MIDLESFILDKILILPAILIGLAVHEFSHAFVADRLGDKTPKFQGRLTLNPFVHIDPIGFIMIIFAGFGWAKPVQINPSSFKNLYKDDLKVSIAGPLANLAAALAAAAIILIWAKSGLIGINGGSRIASNITYILSSIISINCMLFTFNLIPLPGLDGFHILRDIFPDVMLKIEDKIYRYQIIILLIFIATPLSYYLIRVPSDFLYYQFIKLIGFAF